MALAVRLYRNGVIDLDDCAAMADALNQKAANARFEDIRDRLESAAHLATVIPVEAAERPQSDFKAEQARKRFRLVESKETKD